MEPSHNLSKFVAVAGQRFPVAVRATDGNSGACNLRGRQIAKATLFPRLKRDVESSELCTARIEFESVEVLSQHRVLCRRSGEPLLLCPHSPEHAEQRHKKMTRTTAGVHDGDFCYGRRPLSERTGGRCAVVQTAEERPRVDERRVRMTSRPPGTEGVLQQEPNHVVLGEELRH